MKKGRLWGWKRGAGWFLCLFLVASYPNPLAVNTCEELAQLEEGTQKLMKNPEIAFQSAVMDMEQFLNVGSQFFTIYEGRPPESIRELCDSPYVPVDCREYQMIYPSPEGGEPLRIPLLFFFEEVAPGEPGHLEMFIHRPSQEYPQSPDVVDFVVTMDYPVCEGGKIVLKPQERVRQAYRYRNSGSPIYRPDVPEPLKRASVVESALHTHMDAFEKIFQERPLRSLEKFLSVYPFANKLRNDYTGGYARPVTSPSPGDFKVIMDEGITYVEVFGGSGKYSSFELMDWEWKNEPPLKATLAGPASGRVGEKMEFTCTATDPENDPLTYNFHFYKFRSEPKWSYDIKSPEVASGTPFTATYTFTTPGEYIVYCTPIDKKPEDKVFDLKWYWGNNTTHLKVTITE